MVDCFECGCPIDPDHQPRIASGQQFHPTSGHCISALWIKIAERDEDAERYRWLRANGFYLPERPYKLGTFAERVAEIEAGIDEERAEDRGEVLK